MGAAMPLGEQMKYSKEQMMVALTLYNAIGSLNVAILTPGIPQILYILFPLSRKAADQPPIELKYAYRPSCESQMTAPLGTFLITFITSI